MINTINTLSQSSDLTLGDFLALWSTNNGGTRKISINILLDFLKSQGGIDVLNTVADLKEVGVSNYNVYQVLGNDSVNDGKSDFYYWDPVSVETADNYFIVQSNTTSTGRWKKLYKNFEILPNLNSLRELKATPSIIWLSGYNNENDGLLSSNYYLWDPVSTEADNGATVIKPTSIVTGRYKLQYDNSLNVKNCGAVGDGLTDDTVAIQRAFDSSVDVYFPEGTYLVSSTLFIDKSGMKIQGTNRSIIKTSISNGSETILVTQNRSTPTSSTYLQSFILKDIQIIGDNTGSVASNWNNTVFIKLYNVTQWFIQNCTSFRSGNSHVELYGCYQGSMIQCQFEKSNSSLMRLLPNAAGDFNNLTTYNQVTFSEGLGNVNEESIYVENGYKIKFDSCEFQLGAGVTGNKCLKFYGTEDCLIENCDWDGGRWSGNALELGTLGDSSSNVLNLTVRNSVITNAQSATSTKVVQQNYSNGTLYSGTKLLASATQNTITEEANSVNTYFLATERQEFNNINFYSGDFYFSKTYSNETSNRVANVVYTNTSKEAKFIAITVSVQGTFTRMQLEVDGNPVAQTGNDTTSTFNYSTLFAIVPTKSTYQLTRLGTNPFVISSWREL